MTLSAPVTSFQPGSTTYDFFGPVVGTGTVLGAGQSTKTIQGLDMDTYETLLKIGPLSNVQVTGPGIDPGSVVTVNQLLLQNGVPVVVLSKALDPSKISEVGGSFAYTFGYAALSPIINAGFEQPAGVAQVTNGFLHGPELSPPAGDQPWTFTDSSSSLFAGIAGNGSFYTKKNGPAPQGLQVGFIQGKSSISQMVTLAKGTYTLSGMAAQSWRNQSPQSLMVFVDATLAGAIDPSNTDYAKFQIPFSVGAGTHTILFQGTKAGDFTVLIDAIGFQTPSSLPGVEQHKHPVTVEFLVQPVSGTTGSTLAPLLVDVTDRSGALERPQRSPDLDSSRQAIARPSRAGQCRAREDGRRYRHVPTSGHQPPGRYVLRATGAQARGLGRLRHRPRSAELKRFMGRGPRCESHRCRIEIGPGCRR